MHTQALFVMLLRVVTSALFAHLLWSGEIVASSGPASDATCLRVRSTIDAIEQSLGPHLSSSARLCLPGSSCYLDAVDHWNNWAAPVFAAVVEVATEKDIAETVKWSNEQELPFLAISGGHGATKALAGFENGVGTSLRSLNSVIVMPNGNTARIGGGSLSGEVVHALWALGKQTVTGACECPGMVAPMLGGGHGWLQGRYGLATDNLLSARVVLANGSVITTSSSSHEDLFWAIRGAGHNFGIVSSLNYKIYNRSPELESWSWKTYTYSLNQTKTVFKLANTVLLSSKRPVELGHYSYFLNIPTIDPKNPINMFYIFYQGASGVPSEYTTRFRKLSRIPFQSGVSTLPEFAITMALDYNSLPCAHLGSSQRFPFGLKKYPLDALQDVATQFSALSPELNNSMLLIQANSVAGVQNVVPKTTAFTGRVNDLLLSPYLVYSGANMTQSELAALDDKANNIGQGIRQTLLDGAGVRMQSYVNYAHGQESLEALYGYDAWRLERLQHLKKAYDPLNSFRWYAPIM